MNDRLFDPPPKPRKRLSDESVAVAIVNRLIQNFVDDWDLSDASREALILAIMSTNSVDCDIIIDWLEKNRPHTEWGWDELYGELSALPKHAESVLPSHLRAGRFA